MGASAHTASENRAAAARAAQEDKAARAHAQEAREQAAHVALVDSGSTLSASGAASLQTSVGKADEALRAALSSALDRLGAALGSETDADIAAASTEVTGARKAVDDAVVAYDAEQTRAAAEAEATRVAAEAEAARVAAEAEAARVAAEAQAAQAAAEAAKSLSFSGKLTSGWTLTTALGPIPTDCSGPAISYQVVLLDGANASIGLASPANGKMVERTVDEYGIGNLTCEFSYSLKTDSASEVFTVRLVEIGSTKSPLDERIVSRAELKSGRGPTLGTVFCPECGR
ncbi:hypothetical protein [Cellulomonas sp. URHD0024]|uniref:hypothetical protein n=1 Tax=Cellulomonas sp. URHD0024 TaxID=1302620 RepID=UPI00041D0CC4|nr:hypothetical protein [Cellulomonas sp. URHD0024]